MIYIEAISYVTIPNHIPSLFMGGGITNCPDWQAEMKDRLKDLDIVLINPRRANFPINDPEAAREQIIWEHERLKAASAISFWFPSETLCPITLYELGSWTPTNKKLFIGAHPEYKRRQDVIIQTDLVRIGTPIHDTVKELCIDIRSWALYETSMLPH